MAVVGGLRWMGNKAGFKELTNSQALDFGVIAGEQALDGSNPTPIVTPFKKVLAVFLTIKGTAAAAAGAAAVQTLTYDISGGTVNVYAWNDTATADTANVASTATSTFSYIIVGEV